MSNYTEKEIMLKAAKIVEEAGAITTTDLISELEVEMKPDGNDMVRNLNRNDTKFSQKVRNMISHRDANSLLDFCTYKKENGAGVLISRTIDQDLPEDYREKNGEERYERRKKFIARKVDYDEVNKKNKEIGNKGEEFVFEKEVDYLPSDLAEKVRHTSKEEGDGAGYDILSYTEDNRIRFLEVKTTTRGKETPFYLSENERLFLEINVDEVEIVRVFNFDTEAEVGDIKIISGREFLEKYSLRPISYKVNEK